MKVGSRITRSAIVGGNRATLVKLTGAPKVTRSGWGTNAFGTTAFKRGLALGKVVVKAEPSETELLATGTTDLALDPAAVQAIVAQGITPGVIAPATLTGTTAGFPITGGLAGARLERRRRDHSGGVSLTLTQAAADALNSAFGMTASAADWCRARPRPTPPAGERPGRPRPRGPHHPRVPAGPLNGPTRSLVIQPP